MASIRTNALQISPKSRQIIHERDKWCIMCGKTSRLEIAHYISRGSGGLGIPENLVLLCQDCHREYDQSGNRLQRLALGSYIKSYLQTQYPNWDETKLKYRKGM